MTDQAELHPGKLDLGHVGEQPEGEVLSPDGGCSTTASEESAGRNRRVEAIARPRSTTPQEL